MSPRSLFFAVSDIGSFCRKLFQHPVYAGASNAERFGNFCRTNSIRAQIADLRDIEARPAALINAPTLRSRDTFHLPFLPQVRFEFGEHPKHVEECLAGSRALIDRLLGRLQLLISTESWL